MINMVNKYSKYIDHTNLKADALESDIIKLCNEAKEFNFFSVCVNPSWVQFCKKALSGSNIKVCTVIGFPLGQMTTEAKVFETKDAIQKGADEIDMVLNISWLKSGRLLEVTEEIKKIKSAIGNHVLKVIIETCLLNEQDKINACQCVEQAGADFIKTSTGFSTAGAKLEDIKLFRNNLSPKVKIKAAGGVSNPNDLEAFIKAGADRIGTSRGVSLMKNESNSCGY